MNVIHIFRAHLQLQSVNDTESPNCSVIETIEFQTGLWKDHNGVISGELNLNGSLRNRFIGVSDTDENGVCVIVSIPRSTEFGRQRTKFWLSWVDGTVVTLEVCTATVADVD